MSQSTRPTTTRRATRTGRAKTYGPLAPSAASATGARRTSVSATALNAKAQRSSKTTQKLVVLPSAPQTKPLPRRLLAAAADGEDDSDDVLGYETDAGRVRSHKSEGERLSKEQRRRRGFKRITAYCVAEGLKMKTLAGFLKREHNVVPRIFDEAIYAMYHLPLLPGYGPSASIRSSAPKDIGGPTSAQDMASRLSEAEDNGYVGTYFREPEAAGSVYDSQGYIPSSSPLDSRNQRRSSEGLTTDGEETDAGAQTNATSDAETIRPTLHYVEAVEDAFVDVPELPSSAPAATAAPELRALPAPSEVSTPLTMPVKPPMHPSFSAQTVRDDDEPVGEIVFFDYGVIVFFGLEADQEQSVLYDISGADILKRPVQEDDWEVEECHFEHDPHVPQPRIYNDFFTLKSQSHLLKLSIAHAFAQSTLLARYETSAQRVLSAPNTLSIPRQLAKTGALQLKRRDALRLTGKLFTLRRDVNLVSNVLDVPELFWSEASLKDLYDAVREYMEIGGRVEALNEKLGVVGDLLDAIHDHLNNNAMERITWIIIWLIVVACVVEMGEVVARLAVHATSRTAVITTALPIQSISREQALAVLERMALSE